jgi:hypothetical protein
MISFISLAPSSREPMHLTVNTRQHFFFNTMGCGASKRESTSPAALASATRGDGGRTCVSSRPTAALFLSLTG